MEKKYLVTGHWTDKTTAKPVSGIVEITGGTNKQGQPYEIANTDSREAPIDGAYPVGTILVATVNLSVQESPDQASQEQRSMKINPK
jgi:hypothetical protein